MLVRCSAIGGGWACLPGNGYLSLCRENASRRRFSDACADIKAVKEMYGYQDLLSKRRSEAVYTHSSYRSVFVVVNGIGNVVSVTTDVVAVTVSVSLTVFVPVTVVDSTIEAAS